MKIAQKLNVTPGAVSNVIIWGNHSPTMVPDMSHATVSRKGQSSSVLDDIDATWLSDTFDPTVRTRGKAIIAARGKSSAASAATAAIHHVRDWFLGTGDNDYVSMAVPSDGSYGIPEGLIFSFPCRITAPGQYEIVQGLDVSDDIRARMQGTIDELVGERETITDLI